MKYVYILHSVEGDHFYVGVTEDLRARFVLHNSGSVPHTSKYKPWRLKTYVAFSDEDQAFKFEKYLKSPSGRAFAKKRL
jgi:predicted GIY-YIG superfamily endonuclease